MTRLAFALAVLLPLAAAAQPMPEGDAQILQQRLQAIDSNPDTAGTAAYERLQARQSLASLVNARSSQRAAALQIAQWRVETAELAARTEASRRELTQLERERSALIVEASRQDAVRARQEAERLRIQAQIQAEEAARLRLAAEEETTARQQAETVLQGVASGEAAKLRAARQREAELRRREAELLKSLEQP
ncbi:hypothetical protein [Luteimonas terrae]|uniref:DUF4398 domain-containing protein n=1 Tax=Luteimonas terrae TaxID=1530191 RepID=A0A4V3AN76_9GAMM|nr:hypothetical protein [Luteimonas terrae]TDK29969.1 hypothetical protein E2F49_12245 [Luteimonas terrae]